MPGYIAAVLNKLQHPPPLQHEYALSKYTLLVYSYNPQLTPEIDTSPTLGKDKKTRVQQVLGILLFYARAVDPTLLLAINALLSQQAKPIKQTA
eukprot:6678178-Ditylum_brightwellii.AAC.1